MKKTTTAALRKAALKHEGTEEGVACEGTVLESRTVKVKKKAFLFLGPVHARLKLGESIPEATNLAKKTPEVLTVGGGGWVKVTFADGDAPALPVLERWIAESYRLMAGESKPKKKKLAT